jgi:hypothetical protein
VSDSRLESKLAFVVRAFVWEGRFQQAKQVVRTVRGHRQTARDAVKAAKWWVGLVVPRDED